MADTYLDMFNPYSFIWEVSGTSAPVWTWKTMESYNNDGKSNDTQSKATIGYSAIGDPETGEIMSYDIRTDNLSAPFSLFNRWRMIDYSGINGIIYSGDENIKKKYFDNSMARSGLMWSLAEPTYANIIEAYHNIDAARYRIQDFIYNKYYNKIPPNYLITLRRYTMPCLDEPFTLAFSEEIHAQLNTKNVLLPIATATTYMSEVAGNKMEDILKFTWGMNFAEKTSELQSIQSGTPGATGFGLGQKWHNNVTTENKGPLSAFKAGLSATGVNFLGSKRLTPAQMQVAAQYASIDPWAKYGKYTQGPVDVIMKTKIRDQGLNFTNDFNLKFEYELRSLKYVNPKIAMLDVIGNMINMATNSGSFWGGATRYYGNGGGYGRQPGDLAAFARGDYKTYAKSMVDHVTTQMQSMNGGEFPQSIGDWIKLAVGVIKGSFQNMIGSLINGNIGQLGFTQPANALLSDEPTGYWHVTIGNPLNPIAMMGNMCLTDMEMTMGEGLGYDDFPVNVAFACKLSHGKPRDAAAIEAIFNAGKGRYTHSPYLSDLDAMPDEIKKQFDDVAKQQSEKPAMNVLEKAGMPEEKKTISRNKFSNKSGAGEHIKQLIDNCVLLQR